MEDWNKHLATRVPGPPYTIISVFHENLGLKDSQVRSSGGAGSLLHLNFTGKRNIQRIRIVSHLIRRELELVTSGSYTNFMM